MTGDTHRVFFSHAHEDKPIVEQVAARVLDQVPGSRVWLDTFEIISGESLIQRIQEGIEEADRFCVFLSNRSISKPWVTKELNAAFALEVQDRANFVVPVVLEQIDHLPPFLLEKKHIDVHSRPESEWLSDFAILAHPNAAPSRPETLPNLVTNVSCEGSVVHVDFVAQYFAHEIDFWVRLATPALDGRASPLPPRSSYSFFDMNFSFRGTLVHFSTSTPLKARNGLRLSIELGVPATPDLILDIGTGAPPIG